MEYIIYRGNIPLRLFFLSMNDMIQNNSIFILDNVFSSSSSV